MGCSLHDVLRVSADLLEPSAKDKGLELELRVALDLPDRVLLDAGRVQQVVLALCRYAIETCERGVLRIDARAQNLNEQRFVLSLSVAPHASSGETAVEPSPSQRVEGDPETPSGLGLSVARQLVALMGGSIRFGETRGAITLELPVPRIDGPSTTDAPARRSSALSMPLRLPAAAAPILVVDADARAQLAAIELLENLGFEVEVASTAARAVERVSQKKYTLILIATELGAEDGYAAAEALRGVLGAQRPAIVGCTREPLASARARPGATRLDALLQHPLDRTALCVTLAEWLPDETNPASSGTRLSTTGAMEQATRRALAARLSAAPASTLPDLEPGHGSGLLQSFALEAPAQLRTLSRAVARGRRDETAQLAEGFKERCSNCGAMKMAALCRTLEGARDLSLEQLAANVKALGKALDAVLTLLSDATPPAEGVPASATVDRTPDG
jgi:CheY-like chemotaxis protein